MRLITRCKNEDEGKNKRYESMRSKIRGMEAWEEEQMGRGARGIRLEEEEQGA